jgi:hypothetical protein
MRFSFIKAQEEDLQQYDGVPFFVNCELNGHRRDDADMTSKLPFRQMIAAFAKLKRIDLKPFLNCEPGIKIGLF